MFARLASRLAAPLARSLTSSATARALGSSSLAAAAAAAAAGATLVTFAEPAPAFKTDKIQLKDGRVIACRVLGDPNGVPVVAIHGMSSSHLTWLPKNDAPIESVASGVRLIAIDRPGYGGSSNPPACYSYAHFVRDLTEVCDALGVEHFCVAGHSSGGPYALAAAALLPKRVLACAAVSSDPPYLHPRCPDVVRLSDSMIADGKGGFYGRDPVAKVANWRVQTLAGEGGEDKKVRVMTPERHRWYLHTAPQLSLTAQSFAFSLDQYAWAPGVLGFVTDFTLERVPWSFRLEDIQLGERLTLWYGSKDYDPMVVGTPWMQTLVPGSQLRVVPDGKHSFKSEPKHYSAILVELRDQAKRAAARENLYYVPFA